MKIVVLFKQGSANFRFVPGANFVEVEGTAGLGETVWLPAKGGHPQREALLEKAINLLGGVWNIYDKGRTNDPIAGSIIRSVYSRDAVGEDLLFVDIGKVG